MNTLQSIVTPITRRFPKFISQPAILLVGPTCYQSLVYDFNLSDTDCLKYAISKGLGFGIVLGASIVKIPQIVKIVSANSVRGLSLSAYIMETASYAITLAYAARNDFPFSTYGENFFLTIQNVIITLLIVWYTSPRGSGVGRKPLSGLNGGAGTGTGGNVKGLLVAILVVLGSGVFLSSKSLSTPGTLKFLLSWTLPLTMLSKMPQILSNHNLRSTGNLSAFAIFNALAGCIARLFTTSQETGDSLIWWGYALAAGLNLVLVGQMVMYWNNDDDVVRLKKREMEFGPGEGARAGTRFDSEKDIPLSPMVNTSQGQAYQRGV